MHALDRRHAALCWILCPLPFLRAMADSADRETVWSTAFRSSFGQGQETQASSRDGSGPRCSPVAAELDDALPRVLGEHHQLADEGRARRSEEHTSELQSLAYLVCRLLLEKKKKTNKAAVLVSV